MKDIVKKARTYRRFKQEPISMETLERLVELARFAPSGANSQPLRYVLCNDEITRDNLFPCISWAGALKDWDGPEEGERPMAYIMLVSERPATINTGIAAQTIVLGAMSQGIGACMLGALKREVAQNVVGLDEKYGIELLIGLGYPGEEVVVDDARAGDRLLYFRDDKDVHHVPKLVLEDMIIKKI
ncbi:MAG: nitroreductase family protein [Kiritimatiellae bacterium]|jgi:nitroreductase|nr:nitroreductase family protein [Kiritimatiellia bacterium]